VLTFFYQTVTHYNSTFPQSSFAAILESTASFTFAEPCKQYRSTAEFNFIDSTALIKLGDPCKRALGYSLTMIDVEISTS
jgi:hypothetical protein